ncbi:methylated-DNA--protein-cysteine methyltransferase-like [Convolutriloba macropyga]|uniref:methylated-DNA--protein-cysteine methyltransferase-like n=1 Tax=Convolutriloba macropyga TaxID=536237 RepID=UPI003F524B82
MMYIVHYHAPIGDITLRFGASGKLREVLVSPDFIKVESNLTTKTSPKQNCQNDVSSACVCWLNNYFLGINQEPIAEEYLEISQFSTFSREVYSTLLKSVKVGNVVSYSQLSALTTGKSCSSRAVGNSMRNNPLPIFIPCHRVVPASYFTAPSAKKSCGSYCGKKSSTVKEWLIAHEKEMINS